MHRAAAASPVFDVRLNAIVAARRDALVRQFGFTRLDVSVVVDTPARIVRLRGTVLLPHVAAALEADVAAQLAPGWSVDARLSAPDATCWHDAPPGVTPLRRGAPSSAGADELVTELHHHDGPVAVLARHDGATLVRTADGSFGWTMRRLGLPCAVPPVVRRRPDLAVLRDTARGYLGVPYRLGGTTRRGLDCSGLVQRAIRASAGVAVPRHSTDQVRGSHAAATPLGEPGDIVCIWAGPRRSPHVGLVLRGRRPADRTVVHASSTAGCVVEEPLDRFLEGADRVAHVSAPQAVEQVACLRRP